MHDAIPSDASSKEAISVKSFRDKSLLSVVGKVYMEEYSVEVIRLSSIRKKIYKYCL